MNRIQALRAARAKIEDPAHWTRGSAARDSDGDPTYPDGPFAVCWCSLGAVRAVDDERNFSGNVECLYEALYELTEHQGESIVDFNDSREHGDILRMFDRAIEIAEERGN